MYPEPHIPADHELRRAVAFCGMVYVALFWAAVLALAFIDFTAIFDTARPAACDGYTAQECPAAIEASHD